MVSSGGKGSFRSSTKLKKSPSFKTGFLGEEDDTNSNGFNNANGFNSNDMYLW